MNEDFLPDTGRVGGWVGPPGTGFPAGTQSGGAGHPSSPTYTNQSDIQSINQSDNQSIK